MGWFTFDADSVWHRLWFAGVLIVCGIAAFMTLGAFLVLITEGHLVVMFTGLIIWYALSAFAIFILSLVYWMIFGYNPLDGLSLTSTRRSTEKTLEQYGIQIGKPKK